ncbi:DUF916 and DUF3324 domain-containing protein [Vagococcus humatus]|nr:DUF916 and DUF3324 domain-containing protein [Vagococcus humatus]
MGKFSKHQPLLSFFLIWGVLLGLVGTSLLAPMETFAKGEEEQATYGVAPILPENQLDRGRTFYDLRVKPGQKQTIQIKINNLSEKEENYFIQVNTAQTSGGFTMDYSKHKLPEGTPNKTPLSTFVTYPKKVTIPGKKAGVVSINIEVPEKAFEGIQLGGIQVKKDFSSEKKQSKEAIFSEYAYVVGLMLSENDQPVTPEVTFKKIEPKIITNNAGVEVTLVNTQPTTIKGVTVDTKIYKDQEEKPVMTQKTSEGTIAPESIIRAAIFNGKAGSTKPLDAGKYQMDMTITDKDNHRWQFKEPFTITKKQAQQVNEKVFVVKNETSPWLYVLIGILAAIILLFILFFLLKRKKEKEEEEKQQLATKKKGKKRRKSSRK